MASAQTEVRSHVALRLFDDAFWGDSCSIYGNWVDVLMLRTQLYRATQLKTQIQARAESLILSSGPLVVQTISWL